jgi:LysR family transcriptional regulator, regulator of abg operon
MWRAVGVRWPLFDSDSQGAITLRLTQIRDFLAVVEAGTIRAAARKLGISQPTITKSIRGLEADLHVQLLRRSVSGIALTPSGQAFYARARVAQSELRKAEEEASLPGGPGAGSVAFGVGPVPAILILPDAVVRFRQQFPVARIRIIEGLATVLLPFVRDETLDFVMGLSEAKLPPGIVFRALYRSELVVAVRKGHPLRNARSIAQLADGDWLSTGTLGMPGGPLERVFGSAGLPLPRQAMQCQAFNAIVALLAKTDMLGFMQRRLLAQPFARDFLEEIPVAEPLPSVTAGMYTRADTPLTRIAAAMVKAVVAVSRDLARAA